MSVLTPRSHNTANTLADSPYQVLVVSVIFEGHGIAVVHARQAWRQKRMERGSNVGAERGTHCLMQSCRSEGAS